MATYRLMCWQEIPTVVEAMAGGTVHKQPLSPRFQDLIDRAAMRQGLAGTDAYLEHWKKTAPKEREGDPEAVAKAIAAEIEAGFDALRARVFEAIREAKLDRIAQSGGSSSGMEP
jgi:hypothetical protein